MYNTHIDWCYNINTRELYSVYNTHIDWCHNNYTRELYSVYNTHIDWCHNIEFRGIVAWLIIISFECVISCFWLADSPKRVHNRVCITTVYVLKQCPKVTTTYALQKEPTSPLANSECVCIINSIVLLTWHAWVREMCCWFMFSNTL